MPAPPPVSAVILAGGHSRRFGSDKARVMWRGQTLLDHVISTALPLCSEVVLVLRQDQAEQTWPTPNLAFDDEEFGEGPIRGVIAGLERTTTAWAWVLACDLPAIQAPLLMAMRECASESDVAVVPRWNHRAQPLCALYSRSAANHLRAAIDSGERSLIDALQLPAVRSFDEATCREHDPTGLSFFNINQPADLDRLEQVCPHPSSPGEHRD